MFDKMKVGTRLVAGFLLIALLGAVVATIGIVNMAKMNQHAERAYTFDLLGLSAAREANINLIYIGRAIRGVLLATNETDRRRFTDQVAAGKNGMREKLDKARPLHYSEAGKKLFTETDRALLEYHNDLTRLESMAKEETAEGKAAAVAFAFGPFAERAKEVDDKLTELGNQKQKVSAASAQEATAAYESSRTLMIVLVVVGLGGGIGLGLLITRSLTRQLGGEPAYAAEMAGAIAAGELSRVIATRPGDSHSLLFAMESMRAALVTIVRQVRSGTDTIATASSQIASGNLDLSSRTEEQASSLEETASSMEELTSTVKQNADNARQANVLAQSASEVALKGGAVVSEVVDTMSSINESSRKIVDIIGVIDGIAFQTNILALNAAVEAARAGEQGRGFAVVASEVRNLAQRSAAAAKEIKLLIDDSVGKVDAGGRLVDQAGVTMTEIVQSIQRVTDIMSEIAAASMEQTAGIEQVSTAIVEMDQVTQQNAALVEEAAAAAASLQDQAATLLQVVSVFKLDSGPAPAVHKPAPRAAPKAAARPEPKLDARPDPRPAPARLAKAKSAAAPGAVAAPRAQAAAVASAGADEWEEF